MLFSTLMSLKATVSDYIKSSLLQQNPFWKCSSASFLSNCAKLFKEHFGTLLEKYAGIQKLMKHGEMRNEDY